MSKEFSSLNLYREKLVNSIKKYLDLYFEEYSIGELKDRGGTRRRVDIDIKTKTFYIDFHFNTDGTTTVEDFGGIPTCVEIKKNLAHYIKLNCSISNEKKDTWFVVKNIEQQDFEGIIGLLKESDYYKKEHIIIPENKGTSTLYRLKGIYNEDLVITYFNTKTVQIQGKPLLIFNEAMAMLIELLELDEIPKSYNKLYSLEVDKDAIREQGKLYMPNSYNIIKGKLKNCIHQAVYYSLVDADMFEYTAIPLTGFRALEGHIKYALKEFGIVTTRTKRISSFYHKNSSKVYELNNDIKTEINNSKKCKDLEKAYNQYYDLRHMLSHWDDLVLDNDEDTTTMIENIGIARTYIIDTLFIIDSYYSL